MSFIIQFVKEMTSREKAYFRKFAKMHQTKKEKNYLKIYDAIINNENIDKETLKDIFKGTNIHSHFSSEMNYLFEQIMKSLLNYNLSNNDQFKVLKAIAYIELLLSKGEKTIAAKVLKTAKTLAYKKEDFPLIIKLIELEEQILFKQGILGFIKKLEALRNERFEVTEKIENINEIRVLKERIRDFQYTHLFIDDPAVFPDVFANPILLNQSKALSITALDNWHYAHVAKEYVLRSYHKGIDASERYFLFLKSNQHLFSEEKLLPALSNYLLFLALTKDKARFQTTLSFLIPLEKKLPNNKAYIEYIKIGRSLEFAYLNLDTQLEQQNLIKAEHFLKTLHAELAESHKEFFFFRTVRSCINLKEFEKAQEVITSWQQHGGQEFMMSIQRMLKLIILYELRWYRLLETEISTSYKILRRHKKYHRLEKTLSSFFRKILKTDSNEKQQLTLLENQLKAIKYSKEDNKLFEYFNYHRWCTQKIASLT